jgi:hypothetical protein
VPPLFGRLPRRQGVESPKPLDSKTPVQLCCLASKKEGVLGAIPQKIPTPFPRTSWAISQESAAAIYCIFAREAELQDQHAMAPAASGVVAQPRDPCRTDEVWVIFDREPSTRYCAPVAGLAHEAIPKKPRRPSVTRERRARRA